MSSRATFYDVRLWTSKEVTRDGGSGALDMRSVFRFSSLVVRHRWLHVL